MPTPPMKSASTISHLTAGTRQPYSSDADQIFRISASGPVALVRREPDVVHQPEGDREHPAEDHRAQHERRSEADLLGDEPARHRAGEHADAGDHLAPPEHGLEVAGEARGVERIDQPSLDRPGEEREAEADQKRGDRPHPERRLDLPQQDVDQRRDRERHDAEQVRRSPPDGVGHDAGRHLEQHHPAREEGVGRERLHVREPRVEQEDRVDPPDERRRQRVAEEEERGRCAGSIGESASH